MSQAPILPPGCGLAVFDEIDSTNSEALRRDIDEAPLWVWARVQTRGRGRQGRIWQSGRGNLYASLLLPVSFNPSLTPQLSFVAALAVHDAFAHLAVQNELDGKFKLKWPNDVLLGGGKIAGILLESASGGSGRGSVAIGCGLNLAHHPELEERVATSLGAHGISVQPAAGLTALAESMQARLAEWNRGDGFAAIRRAWLERAGGLGTRIEVRLPGDTASGVFTSIDHEGALILRLDDGKDMRITAGDVLTGGRERP